MNETIDSTMSIPAVQELCGRIKDSFLRWAFINPEMVKVIVISDPHGHYDDSSYMDIQVMHKTCKIYINIWGKTDNNEIIDDMAHELGHFLLCDYDQIEDMVKSGVNDNAYSILRTAFYQANEAVNNHLARMIKAWIKNTMFCSAKGIG
jgi:hypothetical protein